MVLLFRLLILVLPAGAAVFNRVFLQRTEEDLGKEAVFELAVVLKGHRLLLRVGKVVLTVAVALIQVKQAALAKQGLQTTEWVLARVEGHKMILGATDSAEAGRRAMILAAAPAVFLAA